MNVFRFLAGFLLCHHICFAKLENEEQQKVEQLANQVAAMIRDFPSTQITTVIDDIKGVTTTSAAPAQAQVSVTTLVRNIGIGMMGWDFFEEFLVLSEIYSSTGYSYVSRSVDAGFPLFMASIFAGIAGFDAHLSLPWSSRKPSEATQVFFQTLADQGLEAPSRVDPYLWLKARLLGYPDALFSSKKLVDRELANLSSSLRHSARICATDEELALTLLDLDQQLNARLKTTSWKNWMFRKSSQHQRITDLLDFKVKQLKVIARFKKSQHLSIQEFEAQGMVAEAILAHLEPMIKKDPDLIALIQGQPKKSIILAVEQERTLLDPDYERMTAGRYEFLIILRSKDSQFQTVKARMVLSSFSPDLYLALQNHPEAIDPSVLEKLSVDLGYSLQDLNFCEQHWKNESTKDQPPHQGDNKLGS